MNLKNEFEKLALDTMAQYKYGEVGQSLGSTRLEVSFDGQPATIYTSNILVTDRTRKTVMSWVPTDMDFTDTRREAVGTKGSFVHTQYDRGKGTDPIIVSATKLSPFWEWLGIGQKAADAQDPVPQNTPSPETKTPASSSNPPSVEPSVSNEKTPAKKEVSPEQQEILDSLDKNTPKSSPSMKQELLRVIDENMPPQPPPRFHGFLNTTDPSMAMNMDTHRMNLLQAEAMQSIMHNLDYYDVFQVDVMGALVNG